MSVSGAAGHADFKAGDVSRMGPCHHSHPSVLWLLESAPRGLALWVPAGKQYTILGFTLTFLAVLVTNFPSSQGLQTTPPDSGSENFSTCSVLCSGKSEAGVGYAWPRHNGLCVQLLAMGSAPTAAAGGCGTYIPAWLPWRCRGRLAA